MHLAVATISRRWIQPAVRSVQRERLVYLSLLTSCLGGIEERFTLAFLVVSAGFSKRTPRPTVFVARRRLRVVKRGRGGRAHPAFGSFFAPCRSGGSGALAARDSRPLAFGVWLRHTSNRPFRFFWHLLAERRESRVPRAFKALVPLGRAGGKLDVLVA